METLRVHEKSFPSRIFPPTPTLQRFKPDPFVQPSSHEEFMPKIRGGTGGSDTFAKVRTQWPERTPLGLAGDPRRRLSAQLSSHTSTSSHSSGRHCCAPCWSICVLPM
jgi:hypothetical protein